MNSLADRAESLQSSGPSADEGASWRQFFLVVGLVAFAVAMRLVPHEWNLVPVGAVALFAGAHFRSATAAFCVPLAAMLFSDAFLGFHAGMPFVYASYAGIVGLGLSLRRRRTVVPVFAAALGGAGLFFLVTNFGAWALAPSAGPYSYPKTWDGLLACYAAGIPFFRATLLGDLVYTGVLFGAYAGLRRRFLTPATTPAPVRD